MKPEPALDRAGGFGEERHCAVVEEWRLGFGILGKVSSERWRKMKWELGGKGRGEREKKMVIV